jgi:hypothetical protein
MLHHFTILQEQGVDAEIDSYIDSDEYRERFGQDVVPYLHGWDYNPGHEGRQFSWLMQLARGAAASARGDGTGTRWFRLGRALHRDEAIPVSGGVGRVLIVSTEGPFRARISTATDLGGAFEGDRAPRPASAEHRHQPLGSGAGTASTLGSEGRLATLGVTGVARNGMARSGAITVRVPYRRLNEALRRWQRLGGRVVRVEVAGADPTAATDAPHRT